MPAKKDYLCKHCGTTNAEDFFKSNSMKSCCLKCHTLHTHQRLRETKVRAIEYLGGKCSKCEIKGIPAIYDFHHKDPKEKNFNWGRKRTTNWDTLKKELDKCILLCSNCHRETHDTEWFDQLPDHHPEKIRRDAREAEGSGLLNRRTVKNSTQGSNPCLSAN